MTPPPPPPPPHDIKYSEYPLNTYRPASTQREVAKNPRAPLHPLVMCPIAVAHNTESVHIILQDFSIPEAYKRHQNTGKSACSLNKFRTPILSTSPAAHSSTLYSDNGSPEPCQYHDVCRNSLTVRIPPGNSNRNAPMLKTSPTAQRFTSCSNDGSPMPLKQADMPRNSLAIQIPLGSSNGNPPRPPQYTKFHHPLPPVPRTSSSPIYEPRQGPSVPNTSMKRQPYTPCPTKCLPIVPSAFPDAVLVDKRSLRQTLPPSSTHSKAKIVEASTTACGLKPVVRTESEEALVGEYGLFDVHRLSQHSERSVEVECSRQMNEVSRRCAGERFQRRTEEELQRRAREEAQRLTREEARRHAEEAAQCLALEEALRRAEEDQRAKAAWNPDLRKRDAAWREEVEGRQESERRQETEHRQELEHREVVDISRNMGDARETAEAQAPRQKNVNSCVQGPRPNITKPEIKPRFSSCVPTDAVLGNSPEQRRREEWAQRGDKLRRKLEQTEHEVWGDEDARTARREEEARHRKMADAINQAIALRTTEVQASRQASLEAEAGFRLPGYITPNSPILDRDTRRRIADAIRDGYPLLARALEDEARRSQYPMHMTFNGDGNSVNIHSVHVTFQGRAARKAARMAEGRNGWRERAEDKAYEWCCTVM